MLTNSLLLKIWEEIKPFSRITQILYLSELIDKLQLVLDMLEKLENDSR